VLFALLGDAEAPPFFNTARDLGTAPKGLRLLHHHDRVHLSTPPAKGTSTVRMVRLYRECMVIRVYF